MKLKVTEAPNCAHCGGKMVKYDLPPVSFSDGLGWGSTFLWICPDDECPIFRKGFEHTVENYGQTSSMRSIVEPDTGRESVIPAFTVDTDHYSAFLKSWRESKARGADRQTGDEAPNTLSDEDNEDLPDDDPYDPNADFTER